MNLITGFEPTRIVDRVNRLRVSNDVLTSTQHDIKYKEDLASVKDHGIRVLRVAVPWQRIQPFPGAFVWEWMDLYMEEVKGLGLAPIMDCLHHTSFPDWLEDGFMNKNFPYFFSLYVIRLIKRYDWVRDWTLINEPLVTILFCNNGIWYPFKDNQDQFEGTIEKASQTITYLANVLHTNGKRHIYIDSCEFHQWADEKSKGFAEDRNRFRFKLIDKLIQRDCPIDVLGVDYYPHSEFLWGKEGRLANTNPVGFSDVAQQYYERFKIPLMLTETNIRGYIEDRQTWFVYMYKQCLKLQKKVPFLGMCWYPWIDSTDWDTLVTEANGNIDPQGIIYLDSELNRRESELSKNIKDLSAGRITIEDFKTYPYQPPLDVQLSGFVEKI